MRGLIVAHEAPPHPTQDAPIFPPWGKIKNCSARLQIQRQRSGIRGFTLIEALVALAVVAAVLGSIGSAIATTVRGTRAIDDRLSLAGSAEALLTALPDREVLRIGRQTGQAAGFLWRIDVTPMPLRDGADASRWRPVAVDIRMQKPGGAAIHIKTVRLIAQAAP